MNLPSHGDMHNLRQLMGAIAQQVEAGTRPYNVVRELLENCVHGIFPEPGVPTYRHAFQPSYYPGPKVLLDRVWAWNRQAAFGIDIAAFDPATIPVIPPGTLRDHDMLVPIPCIKGSLEHVFTVAYTLWQVYRDDKQPSPLRGPQTVRLRPIEGIVYAEPDAPTIKWVIMNPIGDVKGHWTLADVLRDPDKAPYLAGVEAVWMAGLMPDWLGQHHDNLPVIGGLQADCGHAGSWIEYALTFGTELLYVDGTWHRNPLPTVRSVPQGSAP